MTTIRTAMVLAAGRGERMRPLTQDAAKPLLSLGGRSLLDRALDRLVEAGVETVVVNTHWQAERVAAHLATREVGPLIHVLHETDLLDTGGAIRAALSLLGEGPFYVVNGDTVWLDGPTPTLGRLADAWDPDRADAVLLVQRTFQVQADVGAGDFAVDKWGLIRRRQEREIVPYVYGGVQVLDRTLFDGAPDGAFSVNLLWDRAIARERLRAVVHDGIWFHLTTPTDLAEAEQILLTRPLGETR